MCVLNLGQSEKFMTERISKLVAKPSMKSFCSEELSGLAMVVPAC